MDERTNGEGKLRGNRERIKERRKKERDDKTSSQRGRGRKEMKGNFKKRLGKTETRERGRGKRTGRKKWRKENR